MPRKRCLRLVLSWAAVAVALVCAGCTGHRLPSEVHQFPPLPQARVGAEDLPPVAPRSVPELLREAEEAFHAANKAQEEGDAESALRHYTLMLELLIDADLDPAVFYSLRDDFAKILDTTAKQARLYERHAPRPMEKDEFELAPGYSELQVPFPVPERVIIEIEEIQKAYPRNFQAGLDRSFRYVPHIVAELEKAGLPKELVWMAMVESLFTPKIISRAGAGGMWQFMRTTGRRYNLRVDGWVDERYDWRRATQAAIAYLKDLHDYFDGSWPLAITAYNMGENGLERAIASNGGMRNFWELVETPPAANRLSRETKKYYPRFLATLIVTNNPERYGFTKNPQAAEEVVCVSVDGMYALEDLDQAMGYRRGTLAQLNTALVRGITPPEGGYALAVPAKEKERFLAALKTTSQLKQGKGTHQVRRGETIGKIAQLHGVSARELMALNGIHNPRKLQVGQTLQIPGYGIGRGGGSVAPSGTGAYVVKPGDTLYEIAEANDVSVKELQEWNRMDDRCQIQVGENLHVCDPGQGPSAPAGDNYHVVRAGEYPAKIARNYSIPLDDFLKWNALTKTSTIRVGEKLRISSNGDGVKQGGSSAGKTRSNAMPTSRGNQPPDTTSIVHTVAKNESASVIAAKYGVHTQDVLAWNGLNPKSVLRVGQKLVLYPPAGSGGSGAVAPAEDGTGNGAAPAASEPIRHIVAKGQNPTTIAQHYGVQVGSLFEWNNWPKKHVLHIGDEVLIYSN